jgi:uncharacterized protein YjiS (DUF1127 family)
MIAVLSFPTSAATSAQDRPQRLLPPLRAWRSRAATRAELRRLLVTAPRLLEDIGLDPRVAAIEAAKPFWCA